jgi:histidinol-phosphate aminotransferase
MAAGMVTAAVPALHLPVVSPAIPPGRPICLSRNENAYGPSARAIAAMQEAMIDANRYPEREADALRARIADLHGVAPEQVVLGCGSTEIVRMAVDAFAGAGKTVLVAPAAATAITGFAQRAGAELVTVPLARNHAYDLTAMLARTDSRTGLIYIANPDGVVGSVTPRHEIEAFIRSLPPTTFVLIDEAYHHYVGSAADYSSFIDRPLGDHRVIVIRSFSRIYGLAGVRVGYGIAAPPTAHRLAAQRLPDGVNIVGARAALAALDDTDHVLTSARRNADDRQEFRNQANARMVRTIDSHANFVMLEVGSTSNDVVRHFKDHEITLPQPYPWMREYIRVSLGTAADMREFWRVWDLMPRRAMSHM